MNPFARLLAISIFAGSGLSWGAQGPAGIGACSHVLGPVDAGGVPIGFTCEDVGGSALLVWNAAQMNSNINITGGIRAVSFYPGAFSMDGTFTSTGPLAFIGGSITVNGSITGTSVLIAGANATSNDVKTTLLGPGGLITSNSMAAVTIENTGRVTATTGNVVIAGSTVTNAGQIRASNGSAILKAGTTLDIGWNDVNWIAGIKTRASSGPIVFNSGTVTAKAIILEAHRSGSLIISVANQGTLTASESVTLVSGSPGTAAGSSLVPNTFGIFNTGKIFTAKVTVSPYFTAAPGGSPTDRTFTVNDPADRQQLQTDIGGTVLVPTQDNTPTSATSPVGDSGNSFTVTSNIVVPQLSPSLSTLNATLVNATSKGAAPSLAVASNDSERVRGDGTQAKVTKPKARPKAKPVLIRGAFFDSKISAKITSNP
jgi:hypothetical protein